MKTKHIMMLVLLVLLASSSCQVITAPNSGAPDVQSLLSPEVSHSSSASLTLDPLSILVYTEFVDDRPGEEYENTMLAINNTYGTNYGYTNLTDYTDLAAHLSGKDILLIPEQENANTTIMKTVGTAWAVTLSSFVESGGVVVLLDFGNETAPGLGLHIYNESSLMKFGPVLGQYPSTALTEMHRHTFGDALCRRIEYRWTPRDNTFAVTNTDGNNAVDDYSTDNRIVIHKIMGRGHIVFMGFDLSDPGPNYEQIVGNAIRLPHRVVFDNAQDTEYTWEFPPPHVDGFAGGKFVEDLLDAGFAVSRMDTFDLAFFNASDVVICTLPYWTDDYDATEIAALDAYVAGGGSIFIQSDWSTYGDELADLANNFGYYFSRDCIWDTDNLMRYWMEGQIYYTGDNILSHPITTNVERVEFYASDGFSALPANAERIIVTDWDGTACWGEGGWWADWLMADGITTMAVSEYGSGRVCVVLDGNFMDGIEDTDVDGTEDYLDSDNDVLLLNTIHWLAGFEASNDAPLLSDLTHSPAGPADGDPVTVYVNAFDANGLANITCHYRDNLGAWQNVSMTPEGGDIYSASIGEFNASEEKDYYIRAFDSSQDDMESVSDVIHMNGVNYFPETPMLYDPGTTDSDGVFLLNWTASTDADGSIDRYEIQVSDHSQFLTTLDIITAYTDDYLMTVFENDTYYFRVRAVDDDGTVGFWCFQQWINVVIIPGPSISVPILSPASPLHGDSVNVSVDVTDPDGVKNVICHYRVNSGSWQGVNMTEYLGDTYECELGTFYVDDFVEYYIRAYDNSTSYNPTSTSTYSFEIANQAPMEPTLYDPGTVITMTTLTVNWTSGFDFEDAIDYYELQASSLIDFSVIVDEWSTPTTDYEITLPSEGTYYFRVRTVDDHGAHSPWSNVEDITIDISSPTITEPIHSPTDPLHGDTVTVIVNVTDPSGIYNVTCYYRVNSGSWQNVSMTHEMEEVFACSLGVFYVDDVVEYYIEAFDNTTEHHRVNTAIQMFEIPNQPPTEPTLADPGSVAYQPQVFVTWTPSSDLEGGIDHYHLQISRFSEFSVILHEWNETSTSFNITDLGSGIYYIRVRAFDYHGVSSQWSNVESIEIILTTTTSGTTSTTETTSTGGVTTLFSPDIMSIVLLVVTGGTFAIIILIVYSYVKQRSHSRYQF